MNFASERFKKKTQNSIAPHFTHSKKYFFIKRKTDELVLVIHRKIKNHKCFASELIIKHMIFMIRLCFAEGKDTSVRNHQNTL